MINTNLRANLRANLRPGVLVEDEGGAIHVDNIYVLNEGSSACVLSISCREKWYQADFIGGNNEVHVVLSRTNNTILMDTSVVDPIEKSTTVTLKLPRLSEGNCWSGDVVTSKYTTIVYIYLDTLDTSDEDACLYIGERDAE